jgi:hypothetical protein
VLASLESYLIFYPNVCFWPKALVLLIHLNDSNVPKLAYLI